MDKKLVFWIGGFLLVIISLILNGCGNEEKTNSTKNPALSTYVDEFKKSVGVKTDMTKTKDGKYSVEINENIFLFITVDKNKNVKESYVAAKSETGSEVLENAQKALIHSVNKDYNEKQIYATLDKLKVSNKLEDITEVTNIDGAQLTYTNRISDDTSILQAEIK